MRAGSRGRPRTAGARPAGRTQTRETAVPVGRARGAGVRPSTRGGAFRGGGGGRQVRPAGDDIELEPIAPLPPLGVRGGAEYPREVYDSGAGESSGAWERDDVVGDGLDAVAAPVAEESGVETSALTDASCVSATSGDLEGGAVDGADKPRVVLDSVSDEEQGGGSASGGGVSCVVRTQLFCRGIVRNNAFIGLLILGTLYVLLAYDLLHLFLDASYDRWHLGIVFAFFVLFLAELILTLFAEPLQYLSFFFWFDLITLLSLVPDAITLFTVSDSTADDVGDSGTGDFTFLTIARAGRFARLGSRAGRLIKVIGVLVKYRQQGNNDSDSDSDTSELSSGMEPSVIGVSFTNRITRKFVLLVLFLVVLYAVIELFRQPPPTDLMRGEAYGLDLLEQFPSTALPAFSSALAKYTAFHCDLVRVKVNGTTVFQVDTIGDLRHTEKFTVASSSGRSGAVVDFSETVKRDAVLNIIQTVVVILVLLTGSFFFIKDANVMLIQPLEEMTVIARDLIHSPLFRSFHANPVIANYLDAHEPGAHAHTSVPPIAHRAAAGASAVDILADTADNRNGSDVASMAVAQAARGGTVAETYVLLDVLNKMKRLLRSGYGAAGARIMSGFMDADGQLALDTPAQTVDAVFGYFDIKPFLDAAVMVKGDVTMLTGDVTQDLHQVMEEFHACPDRFLGDALLGVWLWDEEKVEATHAHRHHHHHHHRHGHHHHHHHHHSHHHRSHHHSHSHSHHDAQDRHGHHRPVAHAMHPRSAGAAADVALSCLIRALRRLEESRSAKRVSFLSRLENSNLDTYHPNFACALHTGWAVEAALGSPELVQATYVGPHVDLGHYLKRLAAYYQVPVLVSGQFHALLSPPWQLRCRRIDRVLVASSKFPVDLWAVDDVVDEGDVESDRHRVRHRNRFHMTRAQMHALRDSQEQAQINNHTLALSQEDRTPVAWRTLFSDAVQAYVMGDWNHARVMLYEYADAFPADVPAQLLLQFIAENADDDGYAPPGWAGARRVVVEPL